MALRKQRSMEARWRRRLSLDRLEERQLLSVSPLTPENAPHLPAQVAVKFSDQLQRVTTDFAAFEAQHPGAAYQVRNTDLMQMGDRLLVEAAATEDALGLADRFRALGADHVVNFGRRVAGWIPFDKLGQVASLPGLASAWAVPRPQTNAAGAVASQGDVNMRGEQARAQFGVTGRDVTVGVLSDSFNSLGGAPVDYATGDLPNVQVLSDLPANFGSDEGRGMAQLIYDVAPESNLAFASAFLSGEAGFAAGIMRLASEANADVIVDDVIYFLEPMFQDGIIAQAVNAVHQQGVSYFSSAGNFGSDGFSTTQWRSGRTFGLPDDQGTSTELGDPMGDTIDPSDPDVFGQVHVFQGGTLYAFAGSDELQQVTIPEGGAFRIVMQWDAPYYSVSGVAPQNDVDLYLLNEAGDTLVSSSVNRQVDLQGRPTLQDPWEILTYINPAGSGETVFNLAIAKRYAETSRTFFSLDPARPIIDTLTTDSEVGVIGMPGAITDVNVSLKLRHSYLPDVTVRLISPNGDGMNNEGIELFSGLAGVSMEDTVLDDQAAQEITFAVDPYRGSFRPRNSMIEAFGGQSPNGTWRLVVQDLEGRPLDAGQLFDWSLTLRTDANPTPDPGAVKYVVINGPLPDEYAGAPTIYGHANAAGANAVGAMPYFFGPGYSPIDIALEGFSSRGNTPIYFDVAGSRLATPEVRVKPDIVGPDGSDTTFFPAPAFFTDTDGNGRPNFFGTSAAAPHVAGVAALMLQALPGATPDQVHDALQQTALSVPGAPFGLAQADLAIGQLVISNTGSIEGQKFNDLDRDGRFDAGEPALAGFTVFLDQNNNGLQDDVTSRYIADRLPVRLTDNTTITNPLFVSAVPAPIKKVTVQLSIDHTAVGDLTIALLSPEGKRIELANGQGAGGDNYLGTVFDDDAPRPLSSGSAPFSGSFRPIQPLAGFEGDNPNGVWRLEIRDSRNFNVGTLTSWTLSLTYAEPSTTTDATGHFEFNDLPVGTYLLACSFGANEKGWESSFAQGVGRGSPVLFSEFDLGDVDAFELQNYSEQTQDTAGWKVVISDSPYGNINDVNSVVYSLPDSIDARQVAYATDSPANHYFGKNIFWNKSNNRIGSGWAMLIDDQGFVRDWAGWGWDSTDLAGFDVTIDAVQVEGQSLRVQGLTGIWSGATISRTGEGTIQRRGGIDNGTAIDFVWSAVSTIGGSNTLPPQDFEIGPQNPTLSVFLKAGQSASNVAIGDRYFGNRNSPGLPAIADAQPNGPQQGPIDSVQVRFTEPMDRNSFSVDDIVSFTGPGRQVIDEFISRQDDSYGWTLHDTLVGVGYKAYVLDFTSQTWRSANEVDRTDWKHWLTVVVPTDVTHDTALLIVAGGSNNDGPPTLFNTEVQRAADFARATRSVAVVLPTVPNQPLSFTGDSLTNGPRFEDEIIASSFDQFLRSGDVNWPALLPMVKSAVRAMDATQEFTGGLNNPIALNHFVVSGASKRGWTTWLTGIVDNRVTAIMPNVFDALNLATQFTHHGQIYGDNPTGTLPDPEDPTRAYSYAIEDYVNYQIINRLDDPRGPQLAAIVDPLSYLDRLDLLKYDVVSAGDEFFATESSQFYLSQLPGPKYLRVVPNTGHSLNASAIESEGAFYKQVLDGDRLPQFGWTIGADGSIVVTPGAQAGDAPTSVRLWQANNPDFRDFRNRPNPLNPAQRGPTWTSTLLAANGQSQFVGRVDSPLPGWTAYLVEMTYDVGEAAPLVFTTDVAMLSDGQLASRASSTGSTDGGPAPASSTARADLKSQVTGFHWSDDGLILTIEFQPQSLEGNYQLVLGPNILDEQGNPLDQNRDGVAGNALSDTFTIEFSPSSEIRGGRYSDINGNGQRDEGEPGLVGATIYLDLDGDGIFDASEPSAVTDERGDYAISGLRSGVYTVIAVPLAGFTASAPSSGQQTVVLGQSQSLVTNFGDRPSGLDWLPQGPRPIVQGQVEGQTEQNNPVVGAIQVVVPHPTNSAVVYVGTVNGGVWKTTNSTSQNGPVWTALTDQQSSLSIGALDLDPTYSARATLLAGIGRFSSLASDGGDRTGLLRSTNGGLSWTSLGAQELRGKNISGVAARGSVLVAAANSSVSGPAGIYRSSDGGQTFALVSGDGVSGLPTGAVSDLYGDPSNSSRLYAGLLKVGLFRSDDAGATWINVTSGISLIGPDTDRIEFAVHARGANNVVWVGIINDGQLAGVLRSTNQGGSWSAMELPRTFEGSGFEGIFPEEAADRPGGQGSLHFSIVADPIDPLVVYVGGDRQPNPFPNSVGAEDFSGRLFRGNALKPVNSDSQWRAITHDFASHSAPHADSRDLAFDADGNLVEVDDGGIYRLVDVLETSNIATWKSLNGNLQITEFHSVDFDANTRTVVGGAQDVGTSEQLLEGGGTWRQAALTPLELVPFFGFVSARGDGGVVAIDDSDPTQSVRYGSFQNFANFWRRTVSPSGAVIETAFPALRVLGTLGQRLYQVDLPQFYTPLELNEASPRRLVIGTRTHVFESFDQGETLSDLGALGSIGAMAYGGRLDGVDNLDVLYVGAGSNMYLRTTAGGALAPLANYPGGAPVDIKLDPENWRSAYVIDEDNVWRTNDAGAHWESITGNLADSQLRTLTFASFDRTHILLVGGNAGVSAMTPSRPGEWQTLGPNLPNAPVSDLHYDSRADYLLAGTLGRGAWAIPDYLHKLGVNRPAQSGANAPATTNFPGLGGLFVRNGNQLTVQGTAGADQFAFRVGDLLEVSVNGITQRFEPGVVTSIVLDGAGGADSAELFGSAADESLQLGPGGGTFAGTNYSVRLTNLPQITVNGGGGFDRAELTDSPGADVFTAQPGDARLSGNGFGLTVRQFRSVSATAHDDFDQANLFDGEGNDQFTARPGLALLVGGNYFSAAKGFDSVRAYASQGVDSAVLYDSAGDDQLVARPTFAQLTGTSYSNYAKGFDTVRALASAGNDAASLYDSAGDDQLVARPDFTQLSGLGYFNYAKNFHSVRTFASTGYDTATLFDSPGDDQFVARPDYSQLSGQNYSNYAKGFDEVRGLASQGRDEANFYDSSGSDQYLARPEFSQLAGPGYLNSARSFGTVRAFASTGADVASLFAGDADSRLLAGASGVSLSGTGYNQQTTGFGQVRAIAGQGQNTAQLLDQALDIALEQQAEQATLTDERLMVLLVNFRRLTAEASTEASTTNGGKITARDFVFGNGAWHGTS